VGDYVHGGLCPYTAWERGREEKREGAGRQTLIKGREGQGEQLGVGKEAGGRGIAPPELNLTDCMSATY